MNTLAYLSDGIPLQGKLYLPNNAAGKVPGIVVAPEWWGMSEHVQNAGKRLAQAGYAALVMDLYGEGKVTDDAVQAGAWMTALLNNPPELLKRAQAALEALGEQDGVDDTRLGAIGYCFGGKVALEMARAGLPLKAVVSFHGNVSAFTPAEKGKVQAALLVEHGEADSMVTMEAIAAFREEMDTAGAVYHIDIFADARHAFTNPKADANAAKNDVDLAYDPEAAAQSWDNMLAWLDKYL